MNFELAIRAEIATQHLMHESEQEQTLPLEMYVGLGYDLIINDPKKWELIQKAYELDVARALKAGRSFHKEFKYRELQNYDGE